MNSTTHPPSIPDFIPATCEPLSQDPSLTEAAAALCRALRPTPVESLPLRAALGRCLAEPLLAPNAFPPFTRAMMDGYALRADEIRPGARWQVPHETIAGAPPVTLLPPGHAHRIATGAALPPGADTVLRQEWAHCLGGQLTALLPQLARGKDTETKGSVMAKGAPLLPAHTPLTPAQLALAARHGISHLPVHRAARIRLILMGNELSPAGQTLPAGHLYEHNGILIEAAIEQRRLGHLMPPKLIPDDPSLIDLAIRQSRDQVPDLLILVGGTSVGTHDFTRRLLPRYCTLLFEGINTRPGRTAFAGVADNGLPIIALPGSPKAVGALIDGLILPTLRALMGER